MHVNKVVQFLILALRDFARPMCIKEREVEKL